VGNDLEIKDTIPKIVTGIACVANVGKKQCVYEMDNPVDKMTAHETTEPMIAAITSHIYPKCHFSAQMEHADPHTCFILKLVGYGGEHNGK